MYFFKKSSSTTAEMSRSGLPIPNRIPSYVISWVVTKEAELRELENEERRKIEMLKAKL